MALRIAIIGPGRVGTAFARQFLQAGANVLGFVGRDAGRTEQRCRELGVWPLSVLQWRDLLTAHVVVFAVGDAELHEAVQAAVAVGGRRCSLWLHTSDRHDLSVFAPASGLGVRTAALHPLLPFPGSGKAVAMHGALALLTGEPRSMRLLLRLCHMLSLQPIVCSDQNRLLYHAACALAANGATALFGMASDVLQRAHGIAASDCDRIVSSLMQAAVVASQQHGAAAALSGPVRRGDAATVAAHVGELQREAPLALAAYLALMQAALGLARQQGLSAQDCERIAAALSLLRPTSD